MQSVTTSLYLKFLWADSNPLVSLVQIHLIHQSIIVSHDTEQMRGRETRLQPFLDQGPDFDSFSRKRIRAPIIYDVKTINFITTFPGLQESNQMQIQFINKLLKSKVKQCQSDLQVSPRNLPLSDLLCTFPSLHSWGDASHKGKYSSCHFPQEAKNSG